MSSESRKLFDSDEVEGIEILQFSTLEDLNFYSWRDDLVKELNQAKNGESSFDGFPNECDNYSTSLCDLFKEINYKKTSVPSKTYSDNIPKFSNVSNIHLSESDDDHHNNNDCHNFMVNSSLDTVDDIYNDTRLIEDTPSSPISSAFHNLRLLADSCAVIHECAILNKKSNEQIVSSCVAEFTSEATKVIEAEKTDELENISTNGVESFQCNSDSSEKQKSSIHCPLPLINSHQDLASKTLEIASEASHTHEGLTGTPIAPFSPDQTLIDGSTLNNGCTSLNDSYIHQQQLHLNQESITKNSTPSDVSKTHEIALQAPRTLEGVTGIPIASYFSNKTLIVGSTSSSISFTHKKQLPNNQQSITNKTPTDCHTSLDNSLIYQKQNNQPTITESSISSDASWTPEVNFESEVIFDEECVKDKIVEISDDEDCQIVATNFDVVTELERKHCSDCGKLKPNMHKLFKAVIEIESDSDEEITCFPRGTKQTLATPDIEISHPKSSPFRKRKICTSKCPAEKCPSLNFDKNMSPDKEIGKAYNVIVPPFKRSLVPEKENKVYNVIVPPFERSLVPGKEKKGSNVIVPPFERSLVPEKEKKVYNVIIPPLKIVRLENVHDNVSCPVVDLTDASEPSYAPTNNVTVIANRSSSSPACRSQVENNPSHTADLTDSTGPLPPFSSLGSTIQLGNTTCLPAVSLAKPTHQNNVQKPHLIMSKYPHANDSLAGDLSTCPTLTSAGEAKTAVRLVLCKQPPLPPYQKVKNTASLIAPSKLKKSGLSLFNVSRSINIQNNAHRTRPLVAEKKTILPVDSASQVNFTNIIPNRISSGNNQMLRFLACTSDGVGYVPIVELSSTGSITLKNPFHKHSVRTFLSLKDATEWLNSEINWRLPFYCDSLFLKWNVVTESLIHRKQMKPLNSNNFQASLTARF